MSAFQTVATGESSSVKSIAVIMSLATDEFAFVLSVITHYAFIEALGQPLSDASVASVESLR